VTDATTAEAVAAALVPMARLASLRAVPWRQAVIGQSRDGRLIHGVIAGRGELRVSIVAGAHADEPAGTMAAVELLHRVAGEGWGEFATWYVCPQINPDGAQRNARWISQPLDLSRYLRHAVREEPGDDIEFGYPDPDRPDARPRPENLAVAEFLRPAAPFHLHASLHGMAFAEGAWWLIGKDWAPRSAPLRAHIARVFARHGLPLHDIDRNGEKGFQRIEPGFCTTPTAVAMREFFHAQGDPATAAQFLPSSMEYVRGLGGDPLVMVSELPLFLIRGGQQPGDTLCGENPYTRLRARMKEARSALAKGDGELRRKLEAEFSLAPLALETQVSALCDAIQAAIGFLIETRKELHP